MARHPQPRELAELKGADKHNPQRYREEPAKSGAPLGNIPDWLEQDEQTAWFELESYGLPGVLTGADRFVMELASRLLAQFRRDPEGMPAAKMGHLIGCLARLGLTPADRQKLSAPSGKPDNPFDEF